LGLAGKIAVVTGGAGGIGGRVVDRFAEAGAEVYSVDRSSRHESHAGHDVICDLTDRDAIRAFVDEIDTRHGRLDLLVQSAGITRDAVLWKMADDDWTRVMEVNLDAAFQVLKAATPLLRRAGQGAVVLIASINGERGKFGQANYAASKAGLIALGKSAARELGRFGIRVNSVAPGLIRTSMTEGLPTQVLETAVDETALGRVGDPDDVAGAVLFLCSDLSRHITGQVLRVDGGQCMA